MIGCSERKPVGKYPVIDMVIDIGNYQKVYCSDYFTSMELIPLETRKECLLNDYPKLILNDSLIFMSGWGLNDLYVFDHSGRFLNQIGNRGRGPNEYLLLINFFMNSEQPIIYIEDYHHILEYGFDGKFIRSFPKPKVDRMELDCCSYVCDNVLVGEVDYNNGKSQHKYCLFDTNGNVLKCFPQWRVVIFSEILCRKWYSGGCLAGGGYEGNPNRRIFFYY